jgi:hypothetical protein
MNDRHKATLVPSPMGDSVGHWEGDVLVNTVGIKIDAFTVGGPIGHAAERVDARDRALPPDRPVLWPRQHRTSMGRRKASSLKQAIGRRP